MPYANKSGTAEAYAFVSCVTQEDESIFCFPGTYPIPSVPGNARPRAVSQAPFPLSRAFP